MSLPPEFDRDTFAAEYALGVLEDADRAEAEGLLSRDAIFAALVDDWQERFAPLLDEVDAVEAPAGLLERIQRSISGEAESVSNVIYLEQRIKRLKTYSAAISAIAAALLLVIGLGLFRAGPEQPQQSPPPPQPLLVANVAAEYRSAAFIVAFDPNDRTLLVSPAVATPAPGHDHELWLVPASGNPQSLGLVASTSPHRIPVPAGIISGLKRDATIAISVEPVGGSPTGLPTGPVVATGKMGQV